jgi:hypothetical protein
MNAPALNKRSEVLLQCAVTPVVRGRYDTLKRDSQGASITGLLDFTSDLDASQRPANQAASGNCVLLTGKCLHTRDVS